MDQAKKSFIDTTLEYFGYTLSLPERTVRSLAALVGGTTTLLTDSLLPESLRGSTTYQVTFGLFQKFILEKMALVQNSKGELDQEKIKDKYVQRKLLGNILEAAGLLTMRFSPLWILAIAGDAAGGSKVFLNRLIEHLKASHVIDAGEEPKELVDVLEAVQNASVKSATALDQPPLSRQELAEFADDMKASYGKVLETSTDLLPDLTTLWNDMEQVSEKQKVSVEELMGMMVFEAANLLEKTAGTVTAVGKTSLELFDEAILQSYRNTLEHIQTEGIDGYIANHYQPFWEAFKGHFNIENKTWLEKKLTGQD